MTLDERIANAVRAGALFADMAPPWLLMQLAFRGRHKSMIVLGV